MPVRIAVLGAGRIGRLHAEVIEHQVAGAGVSCVYDAVPAASAAVAAELGTAPVEVSVTVCVQVVAFTTVQLAGAVNPASDVPFVPLNV